MAKAFAVDGTWWSVFPAVLPAFTLDEAQGLVGEHLSFVLLPSHELLIVDEEAKQCGCSTWPCVANKILVDKKPSRVYTYTCSDMVALSTELLQL